LSQQLQLRRNPANLIASFTGAQGELVVDVTNWRAIVQDGLTAGGWAAAKLNDLGRISMLAKGIDFNAATGDTVVPVVLPQGVSRYRVLEVLVANATQVPAAAQLGLYTGALQTGAVIASDQSLDGITTTDPNSSGNAMTLTLNNPSGTILDAASLYLNIGTLNGSALVADVQIVISPFS